MSRIALSYFRLVKKSEEVRVSQVKARSQAKKKVVLCTFSIINEVEEYRAKAKNRVRRRRLSATNETQKEDAKPEANKAVTGCTTPSVNDVQEV